MVHGKRERESEDEWESERKSTAKSIKLNIYMRKSFSLIPENIFSSSSGW